MIELEMEWIRSAKWNPFLQAQVKRACICTYMSTLPDVACAMPPF